MRIIPNVWIINKLSKLDVRRLFVASTTPNILFFCFEWWFCDSKKVTNSGMLVTKPSKIPMNISEISNCLHKLFNVFPKSSLIIYNAIPENTKIMVYKNVFLVFPFSTSCSFCICFSISLFSFASITYVHYCLRKKIMNIILKMLEL